MAERCLAHQWKPFLQSTLVRWSVIRITFVLYGGKYWLLIVWLVVICHRSISLIPKSSQREKWLLMTAAAASVARSDTSWKTVHCVKGWLTASHYSVSCNVRICNGCLFYWCRSKHRKDSERRPEHLRDKMDPGEDPRDQVRQRGEHWRKRDALEMRCCYLCGSSAHIKKDCQLYRSPAGSVFSIKNHQKSFTWMVELSCFPLSWIRAIQILYVDSIFKIEKDNLPHINLGLSYDRQCENGKLFLPPFNPFEEFERKGETGTTSVLSVNVKYTIKYLLLTFLVFFFRDYLYKKRIRKGNNKIWY